MAANTAPQVDNATFPLGKGVEFSYNDKQRKGVVHRTTETVVVLDIGNDQYRSFSLDNITPNSVTYV